MNFCRIGGVRSLRSDGLLDGLADASLSSDRVWKLFAAKHNAMTTHMGFRGSSPRAERGKTGSGTDKPFVEPSSHIIGRTVIFINRN